MAASHFIFGLYRVPYDCVSKQCTMALQHGISHFDTAQMYKNERVCSDTICNVDGQHIITTKIYDCTNASSVSKFVKKSENRLGQQRNVQYEMLLHRPMSFDIWEALVSVSSSQFSRYGICNYNMKNLDTLLSQCRDNNVRMPDIHQMEVHPFVDCIPLITYCKQNNIIVQGHTILGQARYADYPPLVRLSNKYKVPWATIMVAWALHHDIQVCINTSSPEHLKEMLDAESFNMSIDDLNAMSSWHKSCPKRFYSKPYNSDYVSMNISDIASGIMKEMDMMTNDETYMPTELCQFAPIHGCLFRTYGNEIASQMGCSLEKYRKIVKQLRGRRIIIETEHNKQQKLHKKGMTCCVVRRTSGPYADNMVNPKPMPVDVTNPDEFLPFFEYLRNAEQPPDDHATFIRGTMFSDGRMDLCKQVVGPISIGSLCDVVSNAKIVKHFLLGNNVALQDHEEDGAHAISSVMRGSTPIETWYLAGNCIGPKGISIIADALCENTSCESLWLKRNPIGPDGARSLNTMLRKNDTLRVLDLHNCALGDEGLANLFEHPHEIKGLRHVYLDANCIENLHGHDTGDFLDWCAIGNLKSLSLSINRLKDDQIIALCNALESCKSLKRLCLSSTHLGNDAVRHIHKMLLSGCWPNLVSLDLGTYKSSGDMGEHSGNFFNDDVITEITDIITKSHLKYFDIYLSKISYDKLGELPKNDKMSMHTGNKLSYNIVHDKDVLRIIRHGKRVVHIDSIYRGKM